MRAGRTDRLRAPQRKPTHVQHSFFLFCFPLQDFEPSNEPKRSEFYFALFIHSSASQKLATHSRKKKHKFLVHPSSRPRRQNVLRAFSYERAAQGFGVAQAAAPSRGLPTRRSREVCPRRSIAGGAKVRGGGNTQMADGFLRGKKQKKMSKMKRESFFFAHTQSTLTNPAKTQREKRKMRESCREEERF